jgi:hypothetical protein
VSTQIAASQDAYAVDSASQSRQLLENKFSDQLEALDSQPGRVLDPGDYEQFLSDTIARVELPDAQGPQLLVSSSPLRAPASDGSDAPVDLDVERDGAHYEAVNPIVDVKMPETAAGELRLPSSGVGIRLDSPDAQDSSATVLDDNKLFYHDAAPSVDLTIAPLTQGAELMAQLRATDAPERLSFQVDLPDGAELGDAGQLGLEVTRSGERLALIGSPSATDARGASIPTHLEQTGAHAFDLVVAHRSASTLYPALVDPPMEDWYNNSWAWGSNTNYRGWTDYFVRDQAGRAFPFQTWCLFANECWGNGHGIYIGAGAGSEWPNGIWHELVYTVPEPDPQTGLTPTAYISGAGFNPMYFARGGENNWATPYAFWGTYASDQQYWSGYNTAGAGMTGVGQPFTPAAPNPSFYIRTNQAVWGLGNNTNRWISQGNQLSANRTAALGGIYINLADQESPSISTPTGSLGAPPLSGWLTEAHPTDHRADGSLDPGSYYAMVLDDHPSLYWRLGEAGAFAADSSPAGSHVGIYMNGPGQRVHGAVAEGDNKGGAVDLNGSNQYVTSIFRHRQNLLPNPSIEANTTGWSAWFSPAGSVSRTTAQAQKGTASLKASSQAPGQGVITSAPASPGKNYSAATQLRGGAAAGLGLHLCFISGSAQVLRCDAVSVNASSGWTRAVINGSSFGVAPANTAFVWLFANNEASTSQDFYVDAALIEQASSVGSYFDGSFPDASWGGATNNSTSTMLGPFENGSTSTFEGWANRDTDTSLDMLFGGESSDQGAPYLYLGAQASSRDVVFGPSGNSGDLAVWNGAWPGKGQWVHWALVVDEQGDGAELFINGDSQGRKTLTSGWAANAGNFRSGSWGGDNGAWTPFDFDGQLDEAAIYDHPLDPARIRDHYAAGPSGVGWVKATVSDPGLGLQSLSSSPGSGFKLSHPVDPAAGGGQAVMRDTGLQVCDGTRSFGPTCSSKHITDWPINTYDRSAGGGPLPNGISTVTLTATDVLGKVTTRTFDARVDRKYPDIHPYGGLRDHEEPGYDLTVDAVDWLDPDVPQTHTAADRPNAQSGVKRIDLYMDRDSNPVPIASTGDRACTATWGSCELTLPYTLNPEPYPPDAYQFEAVATDEVGHQASKSWWQVVNSGVPTIDSITGDALAGWHHNDSAGLAISAHDDAVGVSRITVDAPGIEPFVNDYECVLTCPHNVTRALELPASAMPDGANAVEVKVYGPNNPTPATQTVQIKVNHTAPTITDISGPDDWLKDGTAQIAVAGHADGAGVERATLDFPGGPNLSHEFDCSDQGCEQEVSHGFEVPVDELRDGHNQATLKLIGPGGVSRTATFTLDVDRSAPEVTAGGRLLNTPNALVGADENLSLDIADEGSGVGTVTFSVDGSGVDSHSLDAFDDDAQDCDDLSCTFHADESVDLSEISPGGHTVSLTVSDAAGNAASVSNEVTVDSTLPALDVTGDLSDLDGQSMPGDSASAEISATDQAEDDSGLQELRIEIDGTQVDDQAADCSDGCPESLSASYEYAKADWPPGPHELTITAADAAGNDATQTIVVDEPPPEPDHPSCQTDDPTVASSVDPVTGAEAAADLAEQVHSPLGPTEPAEDPNTGSPVDPILVAPDPESSEEPNVSVVGAIVSEATSSAPAAGFTVGDVACVRPNATTVAETDAYLVGGVEPYAAVYANSAPETDTVYRPTAAGAAIVLNLRGPSAPHSFSWTISLDPGETIEQLTSGALAIVDTTVEDPGPCDVPDAPAEGTSFEALADAQTQMAQSAHDLCEAENQVDDGWVRGIIAPPIAEDQAGHPIPVTLETYPIPDVPTQIVLNLVLPEPPVTGKVLAVASSARNWKLCKNKPSPCGYFSRGKAVDYAVHWSGPEGTNTYRNPQYHDYGGNNCTNFISQALGAGGMKMMRAFDHGYGSWWHKSSNIAFTGDDTESWRLVDKHGRHFWEYGLVNPGSYSPSDWKPGDLIIMNWFNDNDEFDHYQIVTGIRNGVPLMAQESTKNYSRLPWPDVKRRVADPDLGNHGHLGEGWNYRVLRIVHSKANIGHTVRTRESL